MAIIDIIIELMLWESSAKRESAHREFEFEYLSRWNAHLPRYKDNPGSVPKSVTRQDTGGQRRTLREFFRSLQLLMAACNCPGRYSFPVNPPFLHFSSLSLPLYLSLCPVLWLRGDVINCCQWHVCSKRGCRAGWGGLRRRQGGEIVGGEQAVARIAGINGGDENFDSYLLLTPLPFCFPFLPSFLPPSRSRSPLTPWSHSRLGSQPNVGLTPLSIHLPYFPILGVKLIFAHCSYARPTSETFGNFRKPKKQKGEIRCSETHGHRDNIDCGVQCMFFYGGKSSI